MSAAWGAWSARARHSRQAGRLAVSTSPSPFERHPAAYGIADEDVGRSNHLAAPDALLERDGHRGWLGQHHRHDATDPRSVLVVAHAGQPRPHTAAHTLSAMSAPRQVSRGELNRAGEEQAYLAVEVCDKGMSPPGSSSPQKRPRRRQLHALIAPRQPTSAPSKTDHDRHGSWSAMGGVDSVSGTTASDGATPAAGRWACSRADRRRSVSAGMGQASLSCVSATRTLSSRTSSSRRDHRSGCWLLVGAAGDGLGGLPWRGLSASVPSKRARLRGLAGAGRRQRSSFSLSERSSVVGGRNDLNKGRRRPASMWPGCLRPPAAHAPRLRRDGGRPRHVYRMATPPTPPTAPRRAPPLANLLPVMLAVQDRATLLLLLLLLRPPLPCACGRLRRVVRPSPSPR